MEEKRNTNKILIIIIIILLIIILLLIGYISYDKFTNKKDDNNKLVKDILKENNTKEETVIDEEKTVIEEPFDFNELDNSLHEAIKKEGIVPLVVLCKTIETPQSEPPKTESTVKELSKDSIDIIVSKLKEAESIDQKVTWDSFGCPPRNIEFHISNPNDIQKSKTFSMYYADTINTKNALVIGYNGWGHIFKYKSDEEISGFIESLK